MNNGHEPATKQDLAELKSDLKQEIGMLRSEMQHTSDDLKEAFRDGQTELLKAFYNYSRNNDERVSST
jgi:hypothetical protein